MLNPHLALTLVNKLDNSITGFPSELVFLGMHIFTVNTVPDLQLPDLTTVTLLFPGLVLAASCETEIAPPTRLCNPEICKIERLTFKAPLPL